MAGKQIITPVPQGWQIPMALPDNPAPTPEQATDLDASVQAPEPNQLDLLTALMNKRRAEVAAIPAPAGTFPEDKRSTTDELRHQLLKQLNTRYSPEEQQKAWEIETQNPAYKEQMALQDLYKQMLVKKAAQPQPIDFGPALTGVAALTGIPIDRGYRAPAQGNPLAEMNVLADNSRDLYKSLQEGLRSQQSGKTSDILTALMLSKYEADNRNPELHKSAQQEKVLPAATVDKYKDAQDALRKVQDLRDTIRENKKVFGPIKGRFEQIPVLGQLISPQAQIVQQRIDAIRQQVGKLMESGVLHKEDEIKYAKILATLSDDPRVAEAKADELINDMKIRMADYLGDYGRAGYKVRGFEGKPMPKSSKEILGKKPQKKALTDEETKTLKDILGE